MDHQRLQRIVAVGRSLLEELDLEVVLERLLEVARELTASRYAAVGILDESREELEQFVTSGIDQEGRREIGDLPHGRGVLGVLIHEPRPLRLADVGSHPQSYGFPLAHPPMSTFLGVPIKVRGEPWGNLYLTEKDDGEYTDEDEEMVVILADWAALAIANARLYRDLSARRDALERANRSLETMIDLSRAVGGELDLCRLFELVVKRSRALVQARSAVLGVITGGELELVAVAGEADAGLRGMRYPLSETMAGPALRERRAGRFDEIPLRSALARRELGATTAMVAPMLFRGQPLGVLEVFDRRGDTPRFSADDERLLEAFTSSAAMAMATVRRAADEGVRRSLVASESERQRWARELHDETLQELAGLRIMLSGARSSPDPAGRDAVLDDAVELVSHSIENLRALIADLRPAALDELGTAAALQGLAERVRRQSGLEVQLRVDLGADGEGAAPRHPPDVEATVYRLVQEAMTNAVKHAGATSVVVEVEDRGGRLRLSVADDGSGFDPGQGHEGFGLLGMRERVALLGGEFAVASRPGTGTTVSATLPVPLRRDRLDAGSHHARAAS